MPAEHIRLPRVQELAARGTVLVDEFDASTLPRLKPLIAGDPGRNTAPLSLSAKFSSSETGLAQLELSARGEVPLVCQRCLEAVVWQFDISSGLLIVSHENEIETSGQRFDALAVSEDGLALRSIFEDELLAALPLSPVHENVQTCGVHAHYVMQFSGNGEESPRTTTPFRQLGEMLSGRTGPTDE